MDEKLYCENCGYEIENGKEIYVDNDVYCEDCYNNLTKCDCCGQMFPSDGIYTTHDGDEICVDCLENNYFCCEECGEIWHIDDSISVDDGEKYVCPDCANSEYYQCVDCGHYYSQVVSLTNGDSICSYCFERGDYGYCDNCGESDYSENMHYDDGSGCWYCDDCWEENGGGIIASYHSHDNELEFFGNDKNNTVPYFGIELEIDKGSSNIECAEYTKDQFPDNFIYFEHDGSLDDGYENITQPATLLYHYNLKDIYQNVFKYLSSKGYRSHDTSTCGLHVHFNRDFFEENEDLYITRLLYLTEKFWDNLVKFSRRKLDKLQRWANKYDSTPEKVLEDMKGYKLDRYKAVNLTNADTIEFRLFRGTLNINTFIATLQLCNELVMNARYIKNAEELQNLKWEDLLKTDELKTYWEQVKNREA